METEWLDFGHKFADRCGHGENSEDVNERCPVFLQWLDCVHQLQRQFPCSFEFNEAFLVRTKGGGLLRSEDETPQNVFHVEKSHASDSVSNCVPLINIYSLGVFIPSVRNLLSSLLIIIPEVCVYKPLHANVCVCVCAQVKLVQHTYSCLFGTFLCNSGKEREDRRVQERTCSVWSLLRPANRTLRNMLYSSHSETVRPPSTPVFSLKSCRKQSAPSSDFMSPKESVV